MVALVAILVSIYNLENFRQGINSSTLRIGHTPATLYSQADADGAFIIVAHGFAGSRQLMQAYSLSLANAGYRVIAFDFEGHGRNPVPMSGDVTAIDGTTRLLVDETRRVIARARELDVNSTGIVLLGHSMATDVLVRAAMAEEDAGKAIDTIVGISMFSEAVTASFPASLLVINGQWEGRLRSPGLRQLQLVDRNAKEGDTARNEGVVRRVIAAPGVEHVSVLFSMTAVNEALAWIDSVYARQSSPVVASPGIWILLLLAGIVLLLRPLIQWLPANGLPTKGLPTNADYQQALPRRTFLLAVILPAVLTPWLALLPDIGFLPVLVADYLMLHLLVFAAVQLVVIRPRLSCSLSTSVVAALLLAFWGIIVFGLALDRYAASFLPTAGRLLIVSVLSIGTVLFMFSDSVVTENGRGLLWRRMVARLTLILSLLAAAFLDAERLIFLLLILPVLMLFYLVHGLMGRWVARRCGPCAAGAGLGLCLAWALGVSFPLFDG